MSTTHPSAGTTAHSGSFTLPDHTASAITDRLADTLAALIEDRLDRRFSDDAWHAFIDCVTPQFAALVARIELPAIGNDALIGGRS